MITIEKIAEELSEIKEELHAIRISMERKKESDFQEIIEYGKHVQKATGKNPFLLI